MLFKDFAEFLSLTQCLSSRVAGLSPLCSLWHVHKAKKKKRAIVIWRKSFCTLITHPVLFHFRPSLLSFSILPAQLMYHGCITNCVVVGQERGKRRKVVVALKDSFRKLPLDELFMNASLPNHFLNAFQTSSAFMGQNCATSVRKSHWWTHSAQKHSQ